MATKYGFNITIGADTEPFTTALNKLNKPLKDAQSSLKRLADGLKLNPGNTAILQSKFEQLGYTIGDLKNKLDGLKEARANLEKEANGKYTEEQYRTLQKLNGEIAVTEEELKQAQKEYDKFGSVGLQKVHAVGEAMQTLGSHIENVGKKLMPVSLAAGAAITGMVKAASSWEDAWVGVTKTVDGSEEQMRNLEQDLLGMARNLGVSKSELAGFAEALGQSGVAVDNITEFTKVISDLNVATNITGEEGARQLARLFNIMQMDTKEVSNFGSALTALGNNFPTTEREILELSTRMAGTGEIVGLTGQQLLALSAAMTSLGSEAEAGGTAMSKIFKKMQLSIAQGSDQLQQFADVSGLSIEEFSELFRTDALGALQAFTKGLANIQDEGGDVISTLDDMKLSEVRLSDQLLRLVSNTDLLERALSISNQSWQDNYALAEEADKRYGTLTYRIEALKQQVENIGISLGNILLPQIKDIIANIQEWIAKFESLNPQTQEMITKVLMFTAVLAPAIVALGKVVFFGGIILAHLPSLATLIGALTSPITLVIGAIAAAILILKNLYETNEEFRDGVNEAWNKIVNLIKTYVMPVVEQLYKLISNVLKTVWQLIQKLWNNLKPYITGALNFIVTWWNKTGSELLGKVLQLLADLLKGANWLWENVISKIIGFVSDKLLPVVKFVINGIVSLVTSVFNKIDFIWTRVKGILYGIIDFIGGIFTGDWNRVWEGVKQIFATVFSNIADIGKNIVKGIWSGILSQVGWIVEKVRGFAKTILDGIKGALGIHSPSKVFEDVVGKNIALGIGEGFDNTIGGVTKDMVGQINGITSDINVKGTGTVTLQFYPQQMTEADLEMAFNYVNRRFGTQY